jgi:hypothetical protein
MFNLPLSPALLEANEANEIPNNANATITSGTMMHNTLLRKLMRVMLIIMIVPHLDGGNYGYLVAIDTLGIGDESMTFFFEHLYVLQ